MFGCFSLIYGTYTCPTGTLFLKSNGMCVALKILTRYDLCFLKYWCRKHCKKRQTFTETLPT